MTDRATGATTKGTHPPDEACVNSHFFELTRVLVTKVLSTDEQTRSEIPGVITEAYRGMARSGDFEGWAARGTERSTTLLGCHRLVWKEPSTPYEDSQRYDEVVMKDRKDSCFFWEYRPDMKYEAAEVLEKRASEAREAARDRRHTIQGLWLAAVGLLLTAVGLFITAVVGGVQAYYARESALAAWAGVDKEEPPGSAQKAPPVPVSPVAPPPSPGNPRASSPAAHSG